MFWVIEEGLSFYGVAVGIFMTLSGYLLFNKLDNAKNDEAKWMAAKSQVKRILTVYILWSIPYLIYSISLWDFKNLTIMFVLRTVRGWIFNSTFYTIWFMPALAVGILFTYILQKHLKWKIVCIIASIFYIIGSLQLTYSFVLKDVSAWIWFKNFSDTWLQGARGGIFFGMPLIVLGGCASKIKWQSIKWTAVLSIGALIGVVVEAVVLRVLVGGCGVDMVIMMVPACLFITMFLTSVEWKGGKQYRWMRAMSVLIFMTQRLFLTVIPHYFTETVNYMIFNNPYVGSLVICGSAIAFSCFIYMMSYKFKWLHKLY